MAMIKRKFGRLDYCMLNAGTEGERALVQDYPISAFDEVGSNNMREVSAFLCSHSCCRHCACHCCCCCCCPCFCCIKAARACGWPAAWCQQPPKSPNRTPLQCCNCLAV
jgi:hypothetical protein